MLFIFLSLFSIFSQVDSDASNLLEGPNKVKYIDREDLTNSNILFLNIENKMDIALEVKISSSGSKDINIGAIIQPLSKFSHNLSKFIKKQNNFWPLSILVYTQELTISLPLKYTIEIDNVATIYFSKVNEKDVKLQTN